MDEQPFYQRWWNNAGEWVDATSRSMSATTYGMRQGIGNWVENATKTNLHISSDTAKEALPYVTAAAVGGTALLLNEPLAKLGKKAFNGLRWVVTGGGSSKKEGFLEKIPLVGYAFQGLGWIADKLGDLSGYILGGVAALVTFKLFENRGKEPDDTASTKTGAVGRVPGTLPLPAGKKKEIVPVRPHTPPAPPTIPLPQDVAPEDYTEIYRLRRKALEKGKRELSESLQPWLLYANQKYEDRIVFAKSAWLYNGVGNLTFTENEHRDLAALEKRTGIIRGAKGRLVTELTKMGLTPTEAESIIPTAPPLPMHPRGHLDVSTDLAHFAHEFQTLYGTDLIKVTGDGTKAKVAKPFDHMSVTQKVEFLDAALAYARQRYVKVWNDNLVARTGSTDYNGRRIELVHTTNSGFLGTTLTVTPKSYKHANTKDLWLTKEFKVLSGMNKDVGLDFRSYQTGDLGKVTVVNKAKVPYLHAYIGYNTYSPYTSHAYSDGDGLKHLRKVLEQDIMPAVERHRKELTAANQFNTGIVEPYARFVHVSKMRLDILKQYNVALVDGLGLQAENKAHGVQDVHAVDLRHPTLNDNAPRMIWRGTFKGDVFHVTSIRLSNTSPGFTDLGTPIDIDMKRPETGMTAILKRIDALHKEGHVKAPTVRRPLTVVANVNTPFLDPDRTPIPEQVRTQVTNMPATPLLVTQVTGAPTGSQTTPLRHEDATTGRPSTDIV